MRRQMGSGDIAEKRERKRERELVESRIIANIFNSRYGLLDGESFFLLVSCCVYFSLKQILTVPITKPPQHTNRYTATNTVGTAERFNKHNIQHPLLALPHLAIAAIDEASADDFEASHR